LRRRTALRFASRLNSFNAKQTLWATSLAESILLLQLVESQTFSRDAKRSASQLRETHEPSMICMGAETGGVNHHMDSAERPQSKSRNPE
jgi:hypothetical protein